MRHSLRLLAAVLVLGVCATAGASKLTLSLPHHMVATHSDAASTALLRTLWTDERLVADVQLDVYQLPQMRSTTEHYTELKKLAASSRWLDEVTWSLTARETGAPVSIGMPRVVTSARRQRGDTSVPMTTLTARLDFSAIPAGDYRLTVNAGGLTSSFDFGVRTGAEPEVRDEFLRDKASKTRDYSEFRRLQLQRYERDPSRIDALLAVIDRSLTEGTQAEVHADFDRAIAAYEARRQSYAPDVAAKVAAYLRDLRIARDAVPEYFQHRADWTIARDPYTSIYSIRSRATNQVLRVLRTASDK